MFSDNHSASSEQPKEIGMETIKPTNWLGSDRRNMRYLKSASWQRWRASTWQARPVQCMMVDIVMAKNLMAGTDPS